jgi:hypothetical protein
MSRQVIRLIEAALQRPPQMQRHRDDGVGALQELRPGACDQRGEWSGQDAPLAVLEGMDDPAQ